jgi:hypothetical protein
MHAGGYLIAAGAWIAGGQAEAIRLGFEPKFGTWEPSLDIKTPQGARCPIRFPVFRLLTRSLH